MAAKDEKKHGEQHNSSNYSEVVQRLQALVEQLEGGGLSLEDSLEKFAEGIQLVRKGEKLLSEAEKRIEQLLSDDGGAGKAVPLELKDAGREEPKRPAQQPPAQQGRGPTGPGRPAPTEEEDVPF